MSGEFADTLDGDYIAQAQNQKEATANAAFDKLAGSANLTLDVDCSAGGTITVDEDDYAKAGVIRCTGTVAGSPAVFDLVLPDKSRRIGILNSSDGLATISNGGTDTVELEADQGTMVVSVEGEGVYALSLPPAVGGGGGGGGGSLTVQSATITTTESLPGASYADLATPGPAVTLTTGTTALVILSGYLAPSSGAGNYAYMSFAVSGATTVAANDDRALTIRDIAGGGNSQVLNASRAYYITGLTPGSNTFTAKYKDSAGGNAAYRQITVLAI